jgi:hypothetical protein
VRALEAAEIQPEAAARAIGMGRRSLPRRLSEEGTSHREVQKDTRRGLARDQAPPESSVMPRSKDGAKQRRPWSSSGRPRLEAPG